MRLIGKVVVVTGGARGIGHAIAERFGAEGARVVIADQSLEAASEAASTLPHEAFAVFVDVSSTSSIKEMVEQVAQRAGGIDVLVNNAGVFDMAPLLEVGEESFDRLFTVNVRGLFFVLQAVARHMIATGRRGSIVNLASQAGRRGEAPSSVYAATKAAVISITQSAALALIKQGIRVNAIAPGVIDTPMFTHVDSLYAKLEAIPLGAMKERTAQAVPFGRLGRPDEVAAAAVFLASADAEYIIGQTINVDGGNVLS